ncbi:hypothetical protein MMC12_006100 [Toensbergia leucococca]|nr:hypothetical protein [Toensbergia leucococca]
MPTKVRDGDRDYDRDTPKSRDRDRDRDRDRERHRSTRSSRKPSSRARDKSSAVPERSATTRRPSIPIPIPELQRRVSSPSLQESKTSLPYPSFSKAHSKEAVGSRENVVNPKMNLYTPDPTNLEQRKDTVDDRIPPVTTRGAPPSPPLTSVDPSTKVVEAVSNELKKSQAGGTDTEGDKLPTSQSSRSNVGYREPPKDGEKSTLSARASKSNTPSKVKPRPKPVIVNNGPSFTNQKQNRTRSPSPSPSSLTETETVTETSMDSDATSIAPNQQDMPQIFASQRTEETVPLVNPVISPGTPTPRDPQFPPSGNATPFSVNLNPGSVTSFNNSPLPPPPPPPPGMPFQMPKVDYLMHNGGLPQPVPRNLLSAGQPIQATLPLSDQVEKLFAPFNGVLDNYAKVISRNGSLAVATGYRSVARRLLDRLEGVFCRDISSESCSCVMCQAIPLEDREVEDVRGMSWGEILEYVCGRQELPTWPAFTLDATPVGLGISTTENRAPMQKLDVDVPEEYRDHYIRQSKKTKQSVDKWLSSQPNDPSSPPTDVDDDTLTFAMLTHLEPVQRPLFSTLIGASRPPSRVGTPVVKPRSELLEKTGLAIQRLYRLSSPPRDPESAIYLLHNPSLHNILATLAAISDDEWDILTSGRFDGFLRSGAEDTTPAAPSRGPTPSFRTATPSTPLNRGTTPLSRGPTPSPASVGAPVAMDEETEIAVLAEVEREIYLGMEALEDAFEALHCKAESVRCTLRERNAGLSMASQLRRGSIPVEARLGTPASGLGVNAWESETDDGIDDGMSELVPDDSASNASRHRRRRPKRRNERRTPAPVEEEDEDGSEITMG